MIDIYEAVARVMQRLPILRTVLWNAYETGLNQGHEAGLKEGIYQGEMIARETVNDWYEARPPGF